MTLKPPRKKMSFTVFEITESRTTKVKVTQPFIWNRHFKDTHDFIDQTSEFIKQYSYEECYFWRIEIESKVFWYQKLPEALLKAVEQTFFDELFKKEAES